MPDWPEAPAPSFERAGRGMVSLEANEERLAEVAATAARRAWPREAETTDSSPYYLPDRVHMPIPTHLG